MATWYVGIDETGSFGIDGKSKSFVCNASSV